MSYEEDSKCNRLATGFLRNLLSIKPVGKYLLLGDETEEYSGILLDAGWSGVRLVSDLPDTDIDPREVLIHGHLSPDPRVVRLLDGHYVRTITLKDIFNQYPGPYDVIAMIGSGMDREVWENESVQAACPSFYVMDEDGHNEAVVELAKTRGYTPYVCQDHLLMVKA